MRRTVSLLAAFFTLIVPVTVAAGTEATAAPAVGTVAQASKDGCYDVTTTIPPNQVVVREVCPETPGDSGDEAKPVAQRERVCTYREQEIPCRHENSVWDGQCYVTRSDPQPPQSDVVWEGQDEGVIVDCLSYPCVFQADQDNLPREDCDPPRQMWLPSFPGTVDPEVLAQEAIDKMQLQPIQIGIVPDDTPDSIGYIGVPAWFWVEEPADNTYGPLTASANAGGTGVTATARVDRIEWHLDDGVTITCDGPGTPYEDRYGMKDSPDCGHRFETQGAKTITATSYWTVKWTGGGQQGTIPLDFTAETQIVVGELQVLNQ